MENSTTCYSILRFNGHQLPPIISLMCGFSVYILIILKSNFDRGLHNLIMLIKKTTKIKITMLQIESTVDIH